MSIQLDLERENTNSEDMKGKNADFTARTAELERKFNAVSEVKKSEMPNGTKEAYRTLRDKRSEARMVGVRE